MSHPPCYECINLSKRPFRTSALAAVLYWVFTAAAPSIVAAADSVPTWRLAGRVVAVGLGEVAGVRQVGRFHSGGPIPGNPDFLLKTGHGQVLDPERVLMAVAGNFGAPVSDSKHAAGTVLSIDPRGTVAGGTIIVTDDFARSGDQSRAASGTVQVYTAHGRTFRNSRHNVHARTARLTAASGPRYLSINNAFGRPWIANAPEGLHGEGSVTVVDPDGTPLDNAPSSAAGGVFAGKLTNREWIPRGQPSGWIGKLLNYRASGQLTPGALSGGALGTAFLGPSPDGSGFAVFAAVTGNGAVVQIHVQDGVDGLAGPQTVTAATQAGDDPGVIGIAFKWNPDRVLYVADPARDRVVLLHLEDDQRHFTLSRTSTITLPQFKSPVDLAAAIPEIANPRFSSHTTLAGGSDLYVANRGDGSLLRLTQDGRLLARAEIEIPGHGALGPNRIRAIAVSADAQRLWLSLEGELPGFAGHPGALVEVSAFNENGAFDSAPRSSETAKASFQQAGEKLFQQDFTPGIGLGPLFNARSCVACHPGPGGASGSEQHFVRRVAHMDPVTGRAVPIDHPNSPVARRYSAGTLTAQLPRQANVISLRMPLPLYASGDLDNIPDSVIEAQAVSKGDGIKGRVHYVTVADGRRRVGRYGWKAQVATLEEMVADAFANELGIISASAPRTRRSDPVEDDGSLVRAVTDYLRALRIPGRRSP